MSVEGFLGLVFAGFAGLGGVLAWAGWRRTFWGIVLALAAGVVLSVVLLWRPVDDDPYPALMILVIGVYGGGAALAGLVAGRVILALIVTWRGRG